MSGLESNLMMSAIKESSEKLTDEERARLFLDNWDDNISKSSLILLAEPDNQHNNCHGFTINGSPSSVEGSKFLETYQKKIMGSNVRVWFKGNQLAHSGRVSGSNVEHYLIGAGILRTKLTAVDQRYDSYFDLPDQFQEATISQAPQGVKKELKLLFVLMKQMEEKLSEICIYTDSHKTTIEEAEIPFDGKDWETLDELTGELRQIWYSSQDINEAFEHTDPEDIIKFYENNKDTVEKMSEQIDSILDPYFKELAKKKQSE